VPFLRLEFQDQRSQPSAAPTGGSHFKVGAAAGCDLLIFIALSFFRKLPAGRYAVADIQQEAFAVKFEDQLSRKKTR
jgi:hypothetical protein